jgi:hypothetical protein
LERGQALLRRLGQQTLHVQPGSALVYNQKGILVADCNTPEAAALFVWLMGNAPELLAAARNGNSHCGPPSGHQAEPAGEQAAR